uniref:AAA+ ATPase domain-containing protein n=1 Tax=viral metagenome TaxID=1070528 RepID=A0A6C0HBC6_9ZZZZ
MSFKSANKNDKKKMNDTKNSKLKKNKDSDSSDNEDSELEELEDSDDEDTSDSSYKPPQKSKKSKKFNLKNKNKRRIIESDSEEEEEEDDNDEETLGSEDTDTDEDEDDDEDDEEEEEEEVVLSKTKLLEVVSNMFPSKYSKEKLKLQRQKEKEEKSKKSKKADKSKKSSKKSKKSRKDESDSDESEEEEDYYSDDEDDSEYDSEDAEEDDKKIDIVFTIGGGGNMDEYYEAFEDEYNDEGDDADCNSDDEKTFMKENYEAVENPTKKEKKSDKKKSKKHNKSENSSDSKKEHEMTDIEQEYLDLVETKKTLTTQLKKKPKSKILINAINDCDKSIKKLVKKARIKNAKHYHKLIHDDTKYTNEVDYFKKKLSNKEQLKIMNDLKEINKHVNVEKPYRLSLLESKMPAKFKAIALQKLNVLKSMEPGESEYYKIKNWVDTFMKIPFGINKNLSITMNDGLDVCNEFMTNAKKTLDNCVYGLNDAKLQIMQLVGQWVANPGSLGSAIAIKGPPGTGKTSLVKEGISKILGREFAFIALGGTGDSSFLEGHGYTYEGSSWGKIVQILIDSKCMNPVIYFDELDKISDTPRGEEIVGILTHLIDSSQNTQFHDKYFSDIDFDLSKCLFIFSYNDESRVNPILRDRMYRIQTKGYDSKEKLIIARDYLLTKIREQVNFTSEDIIIPDDTITYIASSQSLTQNEAGVRNLKRCLEIIHTKLNLFRLVKPEAKIFDKEMDLEVKFPMTVTRKVVDALIKNEEYQSQSMLAMYC